MSESEETRDDRYADVDTSHLADVEDGCGCTEIWEHTSGVAEQREATESASGETASEGSERHASGGAERDEAASEYEADETAEE